MPRGNSARLRRSSRATVRGSSSPGPARRRRVQVHRLVHRLRDAPHRRRERPERAAVAPEELGVGRVGQLLEVARRSPRMPARGDVADPLAGGLVERERERPGPLAAAPSRGTAARTPPGRRPRTTTARRRRPRPATVSTTGVKSRVPSGANASPTTPPRCSATTRRAAGCARRAATRSRCPRGTSAARPPPASSGPAAARSCSRGRSPSCTRSSPPCPPSFITGVHEQHTVAAQLVGHPGEGGRRGARHDHAAARVHEPPRLGGAPAPGPCRRRRRPAAAARPRMPPSALTSSTAIAARFSVAAANTLPGPDLLVSSPRRWSRRVGGLAHGVARGGA